MKLSQADTKVLTTVFGEDVVNKLSGALPEGDEELSLGARLNGKILTEEQQKELRENGVKQGKEIASKELAKHLEIELDAGEKDPSKVAEKFKTTLSSVFEEKYKNQDPTDEQIALAKKASEWENKYKTVFDTLKSKEQEVDQWKTKFTEKEQAIKDQNLNNSILGALPKEVTLDRNDALLIIKNTLKFDETEDGKTLIKKGEKSYLDPLGDPEKLENVVKVFSEEKGWLKKDGGMNGKDRNGERKYSRTYTPDEARKVLREKGVAPTSPEGLKEYREMTTER